MIFNHKSNLTLANLNKIFHASAAMIVAVIMLLLIWIAFAGISLYLNSAWSWSWKWSWPRWRWQLSSPLSQFLISMGIPVTSFLPEIWLPLLKTSSFGVTNITSSSSLSNQENKTVELNEDDLKKLMSYMDESDGGPPWQFMTQLSTPNLTYQAWYRDPMVGPMQFRTRTVFWNLSPKLVRDFFWDDEFRLKWDKTLVYFSTLEAFPETGTMIVHWIRKLPLSCKQREYVIIRRIWEFESAYYCVTKGTAYPSLPRHEKSRRVNLYYSGWHIRPVKGREEDEHAGSEVLLFHYEDLNVPKGLVKMGAKAATRDVIKRLDAGIQAYSKDRANGALPSSYAARAGLTTKVSPSSAVIPELKADAIAKEETSAIWWLIVGGTVMACAISLATYWRRGNKKI